MSHIQVAKIIPASKFKVFEYLSSAEMLADQLKGLIEVKWQNPGVQLAPGSEFLFLMSRYGVEQPIRFAVDKVVTGNSLSYHQVSGLFQEFLHTIKFEEHGQGETLVTDLVEYQMPFGLLGRIADDFLVRADLKRILEHRLNRVLERFAESEAVKAESNNSALL